MTSVASPHSAGTKRSYQPDDLTASQLQSQSQSQSQSQAQPDGSHDVVDDANPQTSNAVTSTFRNVSACNRCRVRKNKCDQRLPACTACEKAHTRCVGFDPITKKEIPRSYVFFLETRMLYLESLLVDHKISFEPADAFEGGLPSGRPGQPQGSIGAGIQDEREPPDGGVSALARNEDAVKRQDDEKLDRIVSDIGMVSVQGASDRRYLGSASGISFARVVLAAIKSSVPASNGDASDSKTEPLPHKAVASTGSSSMRESYFGLSARPNISEAPFPDRDLGLRLVNLYFEHANPQIPILHRTEFMDIFDQAYTVEAAARTPRQLYLLNIVFAIGAGVIFGSSHGDVHQTEATDLPAKRARLASQQAQPEEYHASAIVHLNSFFTATTTDSPERMSGDLEDLQAILLLAGFALLRPVAPGLWYIVGVAMRLAVDLGLHFEDGLGLDGPAGTGKGSQSKSRRGLDPQERGRREWTRDMRRRLWWCTYCFDRLVSTCVGRPFGISDTVVTTEFPALLDDKYITRTGFSKPLSTNEPSYKLVAHHYLRLRLLQSEILQVLQYQQAQQARARGANIKNQFIQKDLPSQFLIRHQDFRSWRSNVDQRLWEWKESAPQRSETGVAFSPQFLELNYWQAVIVLYRNSLSVPEPLAGEFSPTEEVSTPTSPPAEDKEDQDLVFLKCAEAGQKTLKLYRQLHRHRLVNYTYLATHHLFMAGISFLYAVWHSPVVRSHLTIDDFDFTVLSATSVLGDLMEKCPPAKACRDAFERMSKATVQMCMKTPSFKLGQAAEPTSNPLPSTAFDPDAMVVEAPQQRPYQTPAKRTINRRPPPQFDMDLHELFPEDLDMVRRPSVVLGQNTSRSQRLHGAQQRFGTHSHNLHFSPRPGRNRAGSHVETPIPRSSTKRGSPTLQTAPHASAPLPPSNVHSNVQSTYASYFNINQNSYNPDFMSNMPGMEFLNNLGGNNPSTNTASNAINDSNNGSASAGTGGGITSQGQPNVPAAIQPPQSPLGSAHSQSPGLNFPYDNNSVMDSPTLMRYDSFDFGPSNGFDFGVGMGLDFQPQHGWADPQQGFDLDGFFFGGGSGGGSSGNT